MGFFTDWRSHYAVGYARGLAWKYFRLSDEKIEKKIQELDTWGYDREWEQNLKANHPNEVISAHQDEEARAWGLGARKSTGLNPPYIVVPRHL